MIEIARFFFKLGCLGFGGPIATMAMMESECVEKRNWISSERFGRAYALVKVLPGPAATQMAIYLGQVRGGRFGGAVAGALFILPSFVLVLALSYFYERLHAIPSAEALFQGMQVAALAVIAESVARMAKPYQKIPRAVILALISGLLIFLRPQWEPLLVLGAGLFGAFSFGMFAGFVGPAGSPSLSVSSPLAKVFLVCFKAGFLVFGTGLAIVPILEADVVGKYHWLTHSEFLDGLAIGQITPGPVVITSTFIGYKLAGWLGAVSATLGMFLPGFFNILVVIPLIEKKIEKSPRLAGFTSWAIPVVIGGIIGTSIRLGVMTIHEWPLLVLLGVAGVVVFRWKPPVWLVIPVCGAIFFAAKSAGV